MDLALLVYGISLLTPLTFTLGSTMMVGGMSIIFMLLYRSIELSINSWDSERTIKDKTEKRSNLDKVIRRIGITAIVAAILNIFIPSEKTAYIMVGAYATQKVSENEKVQETGKKVLTLIEQKLDSYIEEGINSASKNAKGQKDGKEK